MSAEQSIGVIFGAGILAGLMGSMTGLGGGALIVPLLTIGFGLDIRVAVGASIVSIIATSSGAAAAYVRDHLTNIRIGMLLELGTTLGGLSGAYLTTYLPSGALFVLFGVVLLASAVPTARRLGEELPHGIVNDHRANVLRLSGSYPDRVIGEEVAYQVRGVPAGFSMMYFAGVFSGLLGIGAGALKVLAMDTLMRLPMKVSTATSNFMIGVTAAASAGVYFWRGDVVPAVAAPVALGVLIGASGGARLLVRFPNVTVRLIFIPVLLGVGIEMLLRGLGVA
jgi:uncharacterized membrane protein YfcA